jgi:hypothetical protein
VHTLRTKCLLFFIAYQQVNGESIVITTDYTLSDSVTALLSLDILCPTLSDNRTTDRLSEATTASAVIEMKVR